MSQDKDKINEELTIEQFTVVIGEIPFVHSLGEGQEYAGPPNKKLAFAVSEELGLEGTSALLRFANLAVSFAKLGDSTLLSPPEGKPTTIKVKDEPITKLLDTSLKPREESTKEKERDQAKNKNHRQQPAGQAVSPDVPREFQMILEKKLTQWTLMHYKMFETVHVCRGCGSRNSIMNNSNILGVFMDDKGNQKMQNLKAMSEAYKGYYGPDCGLPKARLKIHQAILRVSWCSACADETFGDGYIPPALPTTITREVAVQPEPNVKKKI